MPKALSHLDAVLHVLAEFEIQHNIPLFCLGGFNLELRTLFNGPLGLNVFVDSEEIRLHWFSWSRQNNQAQLHSFSSKYSFEPSPEMGVYPLMDIESIRKIVRSHLKRAQTPHYRGIFKSCQLEEKQERARSKVYQRLNVLAELNELATASVVLWFQAETDPRDALATLARDPESQHLLESSSLLHSAELVQYQPSIDHLSKIAQAYETALWAVYSAKGKRVISTSAETALLSTAEVLERYSPNDWPQYAFVNTTMDKTFLDQMGEEEKVRFPPLNFNSYNWTTDTLSELPFENQRVLLLAHAGQSICRKLAVVLDSIFVLAAP